MGQIELQVNGDVSDNTRFDPQTISSTKQRGWKADVRIERIRNTMWTGVTYAGVTGKRETEGDSLSFAIFGRVVDVGDVRDCEWGIREILNVSL